MTLVKNDDGSYSLYNDDDIEIIRGTYSECMDWGFVSTPEDEEE